MDENIEPRALPSGLPNAKNEKAHALGLFRYLWNKYDVRALTTNMITAAMVVVLSFFLSSGLSVCDALLMFITAAMNAKNAMHPQHAMVVYT